MAPLRELTGEDLTQWVAAGGTYRLAEPTPRGAIVELRQCTGELEERREVLDPSLLARLKEACAAGAGDLG